MVGLRLIGSCAMIGDKWPFDTEEEAAEYADIRSRGYALLREAHELWLKAIEGRK